MLKLEELGFTKEDLQEKLLERLCARVMSGVAYDEDGEEIEVSSDFSRRLEKAVQTRVDSAIQALAEKHVLPNVAQYIENITLRETNRWGEKTGKPMTFVEYLVSRAEAYMTEPVSYEGKSKSEAGGYSWSATQTRITHLIDKHLHYSIETAMKQALQSANSAIVSGIEQTVRLKLEEFSAALKVSVETKKR